MEILWNNIKLVLILSLSLVSNAEVLQIDKDIYQVTYDTTLEQPIQVSYFVTNRPKNADRKGMNFKKEPGIHTSDNKDYVNNVWDKGHMAPAAHFSDSEENLRTTFSYLNSALQHEKLNRGAWRFLEAAVREWSKTEDLHVINEIWFSPTSVKLPTGATIPDGFLKIVHGPEWCKSFFFTNEAPSDSWEEYEIPCGTRG